MQVWSIMYLSWMTFALLMAACFIWIVPQKEKVCLHLSPLIVLYAEILLIIQFLYGMNFTDAELPVSTTSGYNLTDVGLVKYPKQTQSVVALGVKVRQHYSYCY